MKYLVDSGRSKDVVVRYNTNLNKVKHKDIDLYELLPHFKRVNMCCSMDATEEAAEWIRTGLHWNSWLDNFKRGLFLNEQFGMDAMVIDVTLTLPGLINLKALIELALELKVKSYVKVTFDFDSSVLMSPMCLPRDLLTEVCDELIEFESRVGSPLTYIYRETLIELKKRQTYEEKYPNWSKGQSEGKKRLQNLADFRQDKSKIMLEDLLKKNEKVLNWWNSIK